MINIPASLKKDIGQLAGVLNQFKSDAVQVKLLDLFLSGAGPAARPATAATAAPAAPAAAVPKRRGRPPGSGKKKKAATAAAPAPAAKAGKRGRRKRSKMGATGALHQLIESGFFKTHRSIADVTGACKSKLGLDMAVTNLSGPLMRFVKEKKLVRAKNKDDKYEYWAK
jgi:hypothetical protein